MISYLGSLDQFSPAAGKAGHCRQMSLCVGSTRRALARQPAVLAPSPQVLRAFLSVASGLGRQRFACSAFSLRGPSARRRLGLRKSLDRNRGPVCRVGEGGFSGAEFAPFLSPLPPTSSGDGAALLWSLSAPLFCERPAVCSSRLIFLLSHSLQKSLPPTALRAFWPVLTLSNAVCSSPLRPLLLAAVWASGVLFCWELLLGT